MICPRVLHSFAMFFHLSHLIPGFCLFRRPSQLAAGPATSVAPRRSATSPAPVGQLPSCSARGSCRRRRRCCAPSATQEPWQLGEVGGSWKMFYHVFWMVFLWHFCLSMCSTYWSDCSKSGGNIRELSRCCFLADVFLVMGESQRDPVVLAGCPKIWRNASWYLLAGNLCRNGSSWE